VVIEAVLFDLDGTLIDRDLTVSAVLARQVERFAQLIPATQASAFTRRVTALDAHGHRDKRAVYATIGAEFGFDAAAVADLVASFWAEYPGCCHLDAAAADTLAALRQRGKRLGIVTNGSTAIQQAAIEALGVGAVVDTIVISEAEGMRKPDPAIFRLAATRLGVPVERCCFVGDHPEVDVLGAQRAGLQAFWKRTRYWPPPEPVPTIDAISELLALIS
jgi:putative hydrolase of the HAD superfamily